MATPNAGDGAPARGGSDLRFARLRDALSAPEPPRPDQPPGASAVLIPLFGDDEDALRVLFTRRHEDLPRHPGEISFPGGRVDPGDAGPREAALREAHEEVGIPPGDVDVLGHLTDFVTFRGTRVSAYVGHVAGAPPDKPASPWEVEEILVYPVAAFLDDHLYEGRRYAPPGADGDAAAGTGGVAGGGGGRERDARTVHYWRFPEATVWGITGEILSRMLRRCWGWRPPSPPRTVASWDAFLPE